jgi:hypothetical protein
MSIYCVLGIFLGIKVMNKADIPTVVESAGRWREREAFSK